MSNTDKLLSVFSESLDIATETVVDDLKYNTIVEWDSISHMALVAAIEDSFGIMLDTDEIIDMSTVAKAKEILKKHGVKF
jgi:acyl carrier protein